MMVSLYEILKSAEVGAGTAPDGYTALMAKNMPFAKGSEHEYTGLCPYTFIGNGTPLLDWYIKGNMVQTGTPSPSSIIMPDETGDKTANLLDEEYTEISNSLKYKPILVGDGTFTMSTSCPAVEGAAALFFLAGNVQSGASSTSNGVYKNRPITVTSISGYVTIVYRKISYSTGTADPRNEQTMLNSGSSPLPYQPYGYKIPILCGGTTTNVYLGEVQTTRQIKKLVLNGTENITMPITSSFQLFGAIDWGSNICYCTHFPQSTWTDVTAGTSDCIGLRSGGSGADRVRISYTAYTSVNDFKTYLQQQYANGTPVTVWYVLATPTTGIVNEPIRKIGDYADSISNVANIPTIRGPQTFDVDTTLKPSEIYLKWKK